MSTSWRNAIICWCLSHASALKKTLATMSVTWHALMRVRASLPSPPCPVLHQRETAASRGWKSIGTSAAVEEVWRLGCWVQTAVSQASSIGEFFLAAGLREVLSLLALPVSIRPRATVGQLPALAVLTARLRVAFGLVFPHL